MNLTEKSGHSGVIPARAALDRRGDLHIMRPGYFASSREDLEYTIVGKDGILHREILRSKASIWSRFNHLELAFDREERLYAIIDDERLIRENGKWRSLPENPCGYYINGGEDLICAYIAPGHEVGAGWQVDWYGLAGVAMDRGGFLIWPWPGRPDKLVLARTNGSIFSNCAVIDSDTKYEPIKYQTAVDQNGKVHILYHAQRPGIGGPFTQSLRYTAIDERSLCPDLSKDHEKRSNLIRLKGDVIKDATPGGALFNYSMAVDPETGLTLIVYLSGPSILSTAIGSDGVHTKQTIVKSFLGQSFAVRLSPAGKDRFHMIVKTDQPEVYYFQYRDHQWSAPFKMELEKIFPSMLGDGKGRMLIFWDDEDHSVKGRWLEIK